MTRHLGLHTFIVAGGVVLGMLFGGIVLNTHPPFFGWLFGIGMGLTAGAFVAAIASGQQLLSGPVQDADFELDYADDEQDIPGALDGPPPRRNERANDQ